MKNITADELNNIGALVSVIVPIYNVEKYLDRCLQSIVGQSYTNLEIILVDDGSPDHCPQMCDEWAQKDARIRVIHKQNAGLGMARNSGMEIASGEYWMFVDSDDYITKDAVEVLLKRIIEDGSDMAVGRHVDVYEDGRTNGYFCEWMKDTVFSPQDVYQRAGKNPHLSVAAWAKLFRRKVFSDIVFSRYKCAEDLKIFPAIINRCSCISLVKEVVYYYYQRFDSLTKIKSEGAKMDEIDANLSFAKELLQKGYYDGTEKWYARAVNMAKVVKDRRAARALFREYFDRDERKQIMNGLKKTTQLKWLCLYIPGSYYAITALKWIKTGERFK